jgi:anti-sigma B factor antagonist
MHGFGLTVEDLPQDMIRVALRGELDLEHAYLFEEEMRRVEAREPAGLVLDLRQLRFVDSSGIARILAVRSRALRAGRRLLLLRGSAAVQRLFSLTGVADLFETVDEIPRTPVG